MNNEKIDYFFNEFDYLIQQGRNPKEALFETAEDYAYVFYDKLSDKKENKNTNNNTKDFINNIKKFSKEIHERLEKLYHEKDTDNEILIEKISRIICKDHGYNPDQFIDYDYPRIDHKPHFIKKTYKWEEYSGIAKEILKEL